MRKLLRSVFLFLTTAYLIACAALFLFQRSLIYFPPRAATIKAPVLSRLEVPGATVLVAERPSEGRQAVIYFGGNAEDVSAGLPVLEKTFPAHALYLLNYRGYAGSTGTPGETALVADALALFDKVAATHPDIVVIGRSLGTGIAVQVASRRRISRLVLVTPYDSLTGLAEDCFPYFPVRLLMRDHYDSGNYAPGITAPALLVAAQDDEVIPMASTQLLLTRFPKGTASMIVVPRATHNSISSYPGYGDLLLGHR